MSDSRQHLFRGHLPFFQHKDNIVSKHVDKKTKEVALIKTFECGRAVHKIRELCVLKAEAIRPTEQAVEACYTDCNMILKKTERTLKVIMRKMSMSSSSDAIFVVNLRTGVPVQRLACVLVLFSRKYVGVRSNLGTVKHLFFIRACELSARGENAGMSMNLNIQKIIRTFRRPSKYLK